MVGRGREGFSGRGGRPNEGWGRRSSSSSSRRVSDDSVASSPSCCYEVCSRLVRDWRERIKLLSAEGTSSERLSGSDPPPCLAASSSS